jgi:DNA-directed RNA polymerases I, II, and III subunit RPABC3
MAVLLEDIFAVEGKDVQGKPFEHVSRLDCHGENYEMRLTLDINTDIYPMRKADKFTMALATTLHLDGRADDGLYHPNITQSETLLDRYDYVMYGKVFKLEQAPGNISRLTICASFGGLLMELHGDPRNLHGLHLDMNLYLLIRRA